MDRSSVITLVTEVNEQDGYGVWKKELIYQDVFANVSSVSASEFFEGGKIGIRPSYRMTVFFGDYAGQEMLIYEGKSYAIYRSYQKSNDTVELYVSQKGGTDGKGNNI